MVTNEQTPAQLRTYRPLRSIFPFEAMVREVTCSACGCAKSGVESIPNTRQDCCDAPHCPCHIDVGEYRGSVSLPGDS